MSNNRARVVAFFLPQFHPVPENDAWWGKGFTEWRNVARARPWFPGHKQPRLPADLGFYDLRLSEVRDQQAELAQAAGVDAFCYYHYWFMGRTLLEKPVDDLLTTGRPDMPFMLCWANEQWTRTWDGFSQDLLLAQEYSEEDDRAHLRALLPALTDPRYVRVRGRPALVVYRPLDMPDPARTATVWREEAARVGLTGLHLIAVQRTHTQPVDLAAIGFDAVLPFQPDWDALGKAVRLPGTGPSVGRIARLRQRTGGRVYRYASLMQAARSSTPHQPTHPCVFPGWDNTPRRGADATVIVGGTPESYGEWLACNLATTDPEGLVFINAWNEWAEGAFLEPDDRWGHAWLDATRAAVDAAQTGSRHDP